MCGVEAKGEPVDSIVNQGSDAAFDLNFLLEPLWTFPLVSDIARFLTCSI